MYRRVALIPKSEISLCLLTSLVRMWECLFYFNNAKCKIKSPNIEKLLPFSYFRNTHLWVQQALQVRSQVHQQSRSKRPEIQTLHLPNVKRLRLGREDSGEHQGRCLRGRVRGRGYHKWRGWTERKEIWWENWTFIIIGSCFDYNYSLNETC